MRTSRKPILFRLIILIVAFAALLFATSVGFAAPAPPPGPDRIQVTLVKYTAYDWYMASYKGNKIVCKIVVDYEGTPALEDVYTNCGTHLTDAWLAQPPCLNTKNPNKCKGYYFFPAGEYPAEKEMAVELPAPTV